MNPLRLALSTPWAADRISVSIHENVSMITACVSARLCASVPLCLSLRVALCRLLMFAADAPGCSRSLPSATVCVSHIAGHRRNCWRYALCVAVRRRIHAAVQDGEPCVWLHMWPLQRV
jgi:hypothetical protein